HAALLFEQGQDAAEKVLARDHSGIDDRLLDLLDIARIGELGGILDFYHLAVGSGDAVSDAGGGGDQIDIELALEALLDNLEMQQAEQAAAEAEAERNRILRLEGEGAVVQLQLFERVAQQ